MAGEAKMGKRKIYFVLGNGTFSIKPDAPGDIRTGTTWTPGKGKRKFAVQFKRKMRAKQLTPQ